MFKLGHLTTEEMESPTLRAPWEAMAVEFYGFSGYKPAFDPKAFWAFWFQIASLGMGKFLTVHDSDGKPAGGLGAMFTLDPFTGAMSAMENFWFVSPTARNSGKLGISLFEAFEKECDARGAKIRWVAHLTASRGEALARFYARRGYKPADQMFRKES